MLSALLAAGGAPVVVAGAAVFGAGWGTALCITNRALHGPQPTSISPRCEVRMMLPVCVQLHRAVCLSVCLSCGDASLGSWLLQLSMLI